MRPLTELMRLRVLSVSLPAPSQSFHGLIFVFSRPHHIALPYCSYAESGCDEPHDYQKNSQRARHAINRWTLENASCLDRSQRKTRIWENERPPIERELHFPDPRKYRNSRNEEKPVRKKYNKQSRHDSNDLHNLAIMDIRIGEVIVGYKPRRLFRERKKSSRSISCKLSAC
jgi:hypothetical protein